MVKYNLWDREVDLDLDKATFPTDDELKGMDTILPGSHHWFESPTNKALHYRRYLPEGSKPRAVCVFQHGIQAQCGIGFVLKDGRKTNQCLLSEKITASGCALYSLDTLGHGFSEGRRFFVPDFAVNRDDLDSFARFVSLQHPGVPLFLMGESYGGCLALHVGRAWQEKGRAPPAEFHGLALTAPAIIGDLPSKPVVFTLRYLLAPLFPTWIPFFMPHPVNPERIWKDEEVRALQTSDRIKEMRLSGAGNPFCLGTAVQLLTATEEVRSDVIPELKVPYCVCHGTEDAAVPVIGTHFLRDKSVTPEEDRVILEQKGAYHDIYADPTAEDSVAFVLGWIEKRVHDGPVVPTD